MTLTIKPVTPMIGAEISGVDLASLSDTEFEQIDAAFARHLVLFFRDQPLSVERHIEFGARFGSLHHHPANGDFVETQSLPPEILRIHADASTQRIAGDTWHSDVSCDLEPPATSILKLSILPPEGGDTLFANMYAAYNDLSAPMKKMLDGVTATHDGGPNYRDRARKAGLPVPDKTYPCHSHPVVRTHPISGQKALYVNRAFTQWIDDIPSDESRAILEFLYQHTSKEMYQCRFQWSVDAIAMWDNRCTMHHAIWDYHPHVRSGHRVTVSGDQPR